MIVISNGVTPYAVETVRSGHAAIICKKTAIAKVHCPKPQLERSQINDYLVKLGLKPLPKYLNFLA